MPQKARILLDTNRTISEISPLLFGGFAEHMGRCVYEGIYDPASPLSDEAGLRTDVMDALRDQAYTTIRYPGGNFLSGYNWLDGVGPKEKRPRKRDLAWMSTETNQFGTNEFIDFCRKTNVEPMLAVNMGTGTIKEAENLVEYCNAPAGTYWSDLRVSHGYADPHNVKYWCVGNEMDGPWQIGHLDAHVYGAKALEAAKLMKWQDPSIKTILCGSSNDQMPTYPEWDRVALEIAWEKIDMHSIHYYAGNRDNDTASYLAYALKLEEYVKTLEGTLRYVKAKTRSKHDVFLTWDEWQVWYKGDSLGRRMGQAAPPCRRDVQPGGRAGRWSVAQPLPAQEQCAEGGVCRTDRQCHLLDSYTRTDGMLIHPSYYPFKLVSNHAKGMALDALVFAPEVNTREYGGVPSLDVSASYDEATGNGAVFIVNRGLTDAVLTDLEWQDGKNVQTVEAWQLAGTDPKALNTWEQPNTLHAHKIDAPRVDGGKATINVPPLSFTAILTKVS